MRLQHAGGAVPTTLTSGMTDVSMTAILVDNATGWPDGSVGPFYIVIDRGLSTEEKVLCSARSGTSITPLQRGADGTSQSAHSIGAAVEHVFTAQEADDANAHVESADGVHGLPPGETIASEQHVATAIADAAPTTYVEQEAAAGSPSGDPSLATPVHALPYPDSTDPLLLRRALQLLAVALDGTIPVILSGTSAPPDPTGLVDGSLYLQREV